MNRLSQKVCCGRVDSLDGGDRRMAGAADWVAVDWGTSRLRVWIVGADGAASDCLEPGSGMGSLSPDGYEPALLDLVSAHLAEGRATRVVVCGMAGARQGWAEAPYMSVPCKPPGAESALRVDTADPRLDVRRRSPSGGPNARRRSCRWRRRPPCPRGRRSHGHESRAWACG